MHGTADTLHDLAALGSLCDHIRRLSEQYDNANDTREFYALEAHQRGLPAYWTSARYHDAAAGYLADLANVDGLASALDRVADEAWPAGLKTRARLLSTLIPLNSAAVAEKEAAVAASVAREDA